MVGGKIFRSPGTGFVETLADLRVGWRTHRVIQMIDENKEQLRNLFRNYNVLDVQPAVSGRAPDDLTTLQVSIHNIRSQNAAGCFNRYQDFSVPETYEAK